MMRQAQQIGKTKTSAKLPPPYEFRMIAAAINDPKTSVVTYSKIQIGMERDFRSFINSAERQSAHNPISGGGRRSRD